MNNYSLPVFVMTLRLYAVRHNFQPENRYPRKKFPGQKHPVQPFTYSIRHLQNAVLHGNCVTIQTIPFRTEFRKSLLPHHKKEKSP